MSVELQWRVWKHSDGRPWMIVPGLLALLMLVSCGSLPKTYYYTLQLPAPPSATDAKTNFVLGVEHFRASEVLRDDRIVFFESPTQLNYYEYHRWGSDPATMLQELALRKLERSGVFAQVLRLPTRTHVDYMLKGQVLSFEETDYEEGVQGRVTLEMTLVRSSDGTMVWSDMRRVERPAEGPGVPGVVKALNESSDQLMNEALPGLIAQVESEFAQISGQSH